MAESSTKPRRYAPRMPPEERRGQLLDATLALIDEHGYEGVSMEGIARRAGVTKPVVYDLFGSLADLLEALLEREDERGALQLTELMPAPGKDADPDEVLVEGLDAFLRAVESRPEGWRLCLMPVEAVPGIVRDRSGRPGRVDDKLDSVIRWAVLQSALPISDVEMLVDTILQLARGAGRQHLNDPRRYSRKRLARLTTDLLSYRQPG